MPEQVRIYAVGDVHGRADLLALLLSQIEVDTALHPVARPMTVFLGDYIDRGPDSKQVIELLAAWKNGWQSVFLKGNHEDFLLRFLKDASVLQDWRYCGGLETLIAYGLRPPINPAAPDQAQLACDLAGAMPESHHAFLQALEPFFICGDFVFVHAGLRPLVPIERQSENDLLWIRDEFLLWDRPFEKVVVHGHTPVHEPEIRTNRINIDTGAFATGRLTCMVFEGADVVPLVDVRLWARGLAEWDARCTGSSRHTSVEAALDALDARRELAAAAAARVRTREGGPTACDREFLTRIDPRPAT